MRKLPYTMELNVSGEICSFAQEEEPPGLSDWQPTAAKNMTRIDLIDIVTISVQNLYRNILSEK
jgi:hypothetical protein